MARDLPRDLHSRAGEGAGTRHSMRMGWVGRAVRKGNQPRRMIGMTPGTLLAVCRVHQLLPTTDSTGVTAIDKRPVVGPVKVHGLGLNGDKIGRASCRERVF